MSTTSEELGSLAYDLLCAVETLDVFRRVADDGQVTRGHIEIIYGSVKATANSLQAVADRIRPSVITEEVPR